MAEYKIDKYTEGVDYNTLNCQEVYFNGIKVFPVIGWPVEVVLLGQSFTHKYGIEESFSVPYQYYYWGELKNGTLEAIFHGGTNDSVHFVVSWGTGASRSWRICFNTATTSDVQDGGSFYWIEKDVIQITFNWIS